MTTDEHVTLDTGMASMLNAILTLERRMYDRDKAMEAQFVTKEAFNILVGSVNSLHLTVDLLGVTVEDIRKNAKGANNWSKIGTAVIAGVPVIVGIAKAMGLV